MKNFILITLATTAFSPTSFLHAMASERQMNAQYQGTQPSLELHQKQQRIFNLQDTMNNELDSPLQIVPFHKQYYSEVNAFGLNTFNSFFDSQGMGNLRGELIFSQTFQLVGCKFYYHLTTLNTIQTKIP